MYSIAQYGNTVYKKMKFAQKIKPYKALKGVGVSKTRDIKINKTRTDTICFILHVKPLRCSL